MKRLLRIAVVLILILSFAYIPVLADSGRSAYELCYFPAGKLSKPGKPYITSTREFFTAPEESADRFPYTDYTYEKIKIWCWPGKEIQNIYKYNKSPYGIRGWEPGDEGFALGVQTDCKVDDGEWQYTKEWDQPFYYNPMNSETGYYQAIANVCDGLNSGIYPIHCVVLTDLMCPSFLRSTAFVYDSIKASGSNEMYYWELDRDENYKIAHSYSFRYRYYLDHYDEDGPVRFLSDWSDVAVFGKNEDMHVLSGVQMDEAPRITGTGMSELSSGYASASWVELDVEVPMSAYEYKVLNDAGKEGYSGNFTFELQTRTNGGSWESSTVFTPMVSFSDEPGYIDDPVVDGTVASDYKKGNTMEQRIRIINELTTVEYDEKTDSHVIVGPTLVAASPWSETIKFYLARDKYYRASEWALEEVSEASGYGLAPDSLGGMFEASDDYTLPITREEFAGVCWRLYYRLTGTEPVVDRPNPFKDTMNPDVIYSYCLGFVDGTAADRFSPDEVLTREQAATMLTRVWKKINLPGWSLEKDSEFDAQFKAQFEMPEKFGDDEKISPWAYDSVYFMAANKIVEGSNGTFKPRPITDYEKSQGIGQAKREQAVAIALRMYNMFRDE